MGVPYCLTPIDGLPHIGYERRGLIDSWTADLIITLPLVFIIHESSAEPGSPWDVSEIAMQASLLADVALTRLG